MLLHVMGMWLPWQSVSMMENAGVYSGDATFVLPAQDLNHETLSRIRDITRAVAAALNVTGQCMYSPQPPVTS